MEGKVVIQSDNDFLKAVGCIFGAYYTLNSKYDAEAISTLEFLQRLDLMILLLVLLFFYILFSYVINSLAPHATKCVLIRVRTD